jgi:hypothetical protein
VQLGGNETPGDYRPYAVALSPAGGASSVRISYSGLFPINFLSAIEDGLPVEIVTEVVVRKKASFFLFRDEIFTSLEYRRAIRYNLIEGRYSVTDRVSGGVLYFTSRNQFLRSLAAEIECKVKSFTGGARYYAEARVVMRMGKLYPPFSFLSILSYTTPWVRSAEYRL